MGILSKLIVKLSYFLQSSIGYTRFKHLFYRLLNDDSYPPKRYLDAFLIFLIVVSVVILVREVKHEINPSLRYFNNYVISLIFLVEYLLRMWVDSDAHKIIIESYERDIFLQRDFSLTKAFGKIFAKKWNFMRSPQAVIDLLAVIPFFHEFRIMRIFILFRVFKGFRYTKRIQNLISILAIKKFELLTLLMFASTVIFISTILIYIIEANNPQTHISTLYNAFYWTIVTVSTVGFGDVVPVSSEGKLVAIVIILISISVLSFTTSIIVSAFTQKLDDIKEQDNIEKSVHLKNLYLLCGWSKVAHITAKKLKNQGKYFVILDSDPEAIASAQKHGFLAFWLDPTRHNSYIKLEIDFKSNVQSVLCLYDDDVQNIYIALSIRAINRDVRIMSLLKEEQNRIKMEHAGVDDIIHPQKLTGMIAREFGGKPVAFEVIHALRSEHSGAKVEELVVDELILSHFSKLENLEYQRFHLVLLGIKKKENFLFNPEQSLRLDLGDVLIFVGEISMFAEFDHFVHSHRRVK